MTQTILSGVSRKMRTDYLNGNIHESTVIEQYKRNSREAEEFSMFGYNIADLISIDKETYNPLLKIRLREAIKDIKDRNDKGVIQNKMSVEKLAEFKKSAMGVGLRKVLSYMKAYCKHRKDYEAKLLQLLLELEFANLSAKVPTYSKQERLLIYERKEFLLYQIQPLLDKCGWKYGYSDAKGKNASYIVYVYLPNDVQVSWHTKDYLIYKSFPYIDVEWDGQVCATMDKLLAYVGKRYFNNDANGIS